MNQTSNSNLRELIVIASPEMESRLVALCQKNYTLYSASTKQEALFLLAQYQNALILIEQKLVCDIVRAEIQKQQHKAILLSLAPSFEQGIQALQQGFMGYGNILSHPDRLLAAIQLVAAGDVWLGASIVEGLKSSSAIAPSDESTANQDSDKSILIKNLTPKESQVAQQVVQGHSNKDIASALNMTERTVKAHLSSIYGKLKIKNRTDLTYQFKNNL